LGLEAWGFDVLKLGAWAWGLGLRLGALRLGVWGLGLKLEGLGLGLRARE
jgi:hypothetical protein